MDLVSYIQNYLKGPSTAVATRPSGSLAVPGTALTPRSGPPIIDGEWSEIPRLLKGPAGAVARRAVGAGAGRTGLAAMFGPMGAMIGAGDGRPDNSLSDMNALTNAYKQAKAAKTAGMPPVQPLDDAPQRGLPPQPQLPWWASGDMTKMYPGAAPQVPMPQPRPQQAPQAQPQVPMPQPRPPQAPPAQPDTSFFMRNALMMRDPNSNEFIDPAGAQSVRGPDLIQKMMGYLNNKVS